MILQAKNIHKRFGGVHALQGASLDVQEGTITALIGPNGSGKTTLFDCISKLITQDEGTITLQARDITHADAHAIAADISRTFQDPRLFTNLTIQDHLAISHNTGDEHLRNMLKAPAGDQETAKQALARVGLDKPLDTPASDLSYGQRKLLDLAIATSKPHKLLMLDEPVAGVNPKLREKIKGVLKQLRKDGETILLIEHDMNFVMGLADTIHVLAQGAVIASDEPKKIKKDKQVLEAYLGE